MIEQFLKPPSNRFTQSRKDRKVNLKLYAIAWRLGDWA